MGIPYFWTLLESYGTKQTFKKVNAAALPIRSSSPRRWPFNFPSANGREQAPPANATGNPRHAVIDGPSLAYWAYGSALAKHRAQRSPTAESDLTFVVPPYKETNEVILTWLDTLGSYGFDIRAIYFDGALPRSKRGERLSRLQSSIGKLLTYRKDTPAQGNQFQSVNKLSGDRGLATPFLVPAAIECLRSSKYRNRVQLVPGEADVFCAQHVDREGEGYMFSDDSDLLVYNLGVDIHIVRFHGSENWHANDDSLTLTSFCSATVAESLGLTSLKPMAFAVSQTTYPRLAAVVESAKQFERGNFIDAPQKEAHDLFIEHYTIGVSSPNTQQHGTDSIENLHLDPRTSEWLVQEADLSSKEDSYVYLPFLLEDPLQSAAWNSGSLLRQLAYTCYKTRKDDNESPTTRTTTEVFRKGDSASAIKLPRLSTDQAELHSKAWIDTLKMFGILPNNNTMLVDGKTSPVHAALWRAVALTVVLRQIMEENKTFPSKSTIIAMLKGHTLFNEWSTLHLSAQMQAVLYSFRMLKQILNASSFESDRHVIEMEGLTLNDHARTLYKQLIQLPALADLHGAEGSLLVETSCNRLVGLIARALGIKVSVFEERAVVGVKKKKRKRILKK